MRKKIKETACGPSCDWHRPEAGNEKKENRDRIYRHKGQCRWSGVKRDRYKLQDGGWSAITRNVLIGNCGESAKFHLRYFEIASGGYSSKERHRHEHVVICVKGKGKVLISNRLHSVKHLDTVYIAPNTAHQLSNPYEEPFGFFCIVNAKRDKPRIIK